MAVEELIVPHLPTYNYGVGIERLSGAAKNLVVNQTQKPPVDHRGDVQFFNALRLTSTNDLEQNLGIDVGVSYGCAAFGAGVSDRFSFAKESQVHSSTLFMAITATIHVADQSIDESTLTPAASQVVDHPDIFAERYGDMFARACKRGGLFVGLMRVETFDEKEASDIENQLKGAYGAFAADAQVKFKQVISQHNVNVYCTVYSEGGPAVQIKDPTDPTELLALADSWLKALHDDPDTNSVAYEWTLSPVIIAEGPLPLNEAQIENAQDTLKYCAEQRASLLDQLNQLSWWINHRDMYDWTDAATLEEVQQAARATQVDLDTLAACASNAINSPGDAKLPAVYAPKMDPPRTYPSAVPPKAPKPLPGAQRPPSQVPIPDVTSDSLATAQSALAPRIRGGDGSGRRLSSLGGVAYPGFWRSSRNYRDSTRSWHLG